MTIKPSSDKKNKSVKKNPKKQKKHTKNQKKPEECKTPQISIA
jgi:hypothetical protein